MEPLVAGAVVPVRLRDREAARVVVLAALAVGCLVPSVARLVAPRAAVAPAALCSGEASRVGSRVACASEGVALSSVESLWVGRKIDINAAPASELVLVRGIGDKLAARIVADRDERGPFESIADVARVKGIGPKLSSRLHAFFEVR